MKNVLTQGLGHVIFSLTLMIFEHFTPKNRLEIASGKRF
jgi:hypothetical protein